jgi:diadenosine tetraphosphate (Ap4A) HIT family hydrolase
VVPGHTLVVPRRCVACFDDLLPSEVTGILSIRAAVKIALRTAFDAEGFNYAWNEGVVAGQTVPHFHLHILPRRDGDTGVLGYDPRQYFYRPGPREDSKIEDLERTAVMIRARNRLNDSAA